MAVEAGVPAYYAVLEGTSVVLLEKTEAINGVVASIPFPTRNHWSSTSSGLAMVAFSEPGKARHLLDLERSSQQEPQTPGAQLEAALEEVRRRGYAERNIDGSRYTLCAPILDYTGYAIGGLAVSMVTVSRSAAHADRDQVVNLLREAAARCSAQAGHAMTLQVP